MKTSLPALNTCSLTNAGGGSSNPFAQAKEAQLSAKQVRVRVRVRVRD
jgi:hypothetical protein